MARAIIAAAMPRSAAAAATAGGATRRLTRVCSVGVGGTPRASRVLVLFPSAPTSVVVVTAWQRSTKHTRELLLCVHLAVYQQSVGGPFNANDAEAVVLVLRGVARANFGGIS